MFFYIYHFYVFLTAYSKFLIIASSFILRYFSLCSYNNRSFSAPFSSLAFWVAAKFASLFFLSYSSFLGSDSTLMSYSSRCLNTSMILSLAFFLIHFFIKSPVLFFSVDLTSSMIMSFKSSLKISLTL